MLYIHTSKIANILGYNKYTTKETNNNIFMEYLYKNRNDLKEFDERISNIKILNDKEQMEELINDIPINLKRKVNEILDTNIQNNTELLSNTNKITNIFNNLSIDKNKQEQIKSKMNSKINCTYGSNTENKSIKIYEEKTNNKVYNNNSKLYTSHIDNFYICGKIDGFVNMYDKLYLFEIKNRKHKLFDTIPIYEKIQLLTYTKLLICTDIIFVQCIDKEIKVDVLDNFEDEALWKEIVTKLKKYTKLIYKLQNNSKLRLEFLKKNEYERYNFIMNMLI